MIKKLILLFFLLILVIVFFACDNNKKSYNMTANNDNLRKDDELMDKELKGNKLIYLAGGCFWGTEKYLGLINGVVKTEVGYANGNTENPSYEDVCRRNTGHAETVDVYKRQALAISSFILSLA